MYQCHSMKENQNKKNGRPFGPCPTPYKGGKIAENKQIRIHKSTTDNLTDLKKEKKLRTFNEVVNFLFDKYNQANPKP